jgi:HK97 family phage major capsid protein
MFKSKAMKALMAALNKAQSEASGFTAESKIEEITAKTEEIKNITARIEALKAAEAGKEFDENGEEVVDKTPINTPVFAQPKDHTSAGIRVFKNFAEQLKAVKNAASGSVDERLIRLNKEFQNASGMNEGIGTEGGFAVQTDFAGMMMDSAAKAGNILPLVDQYEVSAGANSVKWVDIDETSVATTVFGGVQVYWASEAAAVNASKPKLIEKELKLEKLMGLAYATYELESDSNFISQLYSKAFSLGIQRTLEGAIIAGDGKGKPLGLLNSGAKVAVAKESGQAAATVLWENISKMYNRALNKDQISKFVWLAHPDLAEQFDFLQFPIGTGGVPVYLPAAQVGSVATLKGRSIIESDHCSALGTEGDLIFANLSDYMLIKKGGVQADTSIHVQFLAAENAFRFIFRANGMPKRNSALTIKNSSNARSNIVTLATRA